MKGLFFILSAAILQTANAQIKDSAVIIKKGTSDSVTRHLPFPSARFNYAFPANNNKIANPSQAAPHTVKLYWDPVYLRLVPFSRQEFHKETFFTNTANAVLPFLLPNTAGLKQQK